MTIQNGYTGSAIPMVERNNVVIETPNMQIEDNHRRFKMVALDLDGTLLHSDHLPSEETCKYLRYLERQGFTIVIATGRSASTVFPTIQKLALANPIPVVCSNGARGIMCTLDTPTGSVSYKELFLTPVPENVARRTIDLSKSLGHVSQYYVQDDIYADPRLAHHYQLTGLYMELTGCQTIYVTDDFEHALTKVGLPSKQLVLCRKEEQDHMINVFEKEFQNNQGLSATIVRGNLGWFLEILHPDVHKGHGLQKMCNHLDIPLTQVVAFGDGDNDYEFVQLAGRGVVMKNGRDVVKKIADEIIDYTNDEDGVLKTLQRMEKDGQLVFSSARE